MSGSGEADVSVEASGGLAKPLQPDRLRAGHELKAAIWGRSRDLDVHGRSVGRTHCRRSIASPHTSVAPPVGEVVKAGMMAAHAPRVSAVAVRLVPPRLRTVRARSASVSFIVPEASAAAPGCFRACFEIAVVAGAAR